MNYNNKRFRPLKNTENGETTEDTIFHYRQKESILTSDYKGGKIVVGHLVGLVADNGDIDMRYHHVNTDGVLMTGICSSRPELDADGKIRLYEDWQWTSGDQSKGRSVLIEI